MRTHTPAADGMRQLAVVSEHEYLFTNNPLITSAGGGMKKPQTQAGEHLQVMRGLHLTQSFAQ